MITEKSKRREKEELIFFNKAVEYFEKYNENSFLRNQDSLLQEENQLREEMLSELNNLKEILSNSPDRKFNSLNEKQKEEFYEFVKFYATCPICGAFNHYYNLKKFYFDDSKIHIKKHLIKMMNNNIPKLNKYDFNFGIPCCNCYKKNFEKERN